MWQNNSGMIFRETLEYTTLFLSLYSERLCIDLTENVCVCRMRFACGVPNTHDNPKTLVFPMWHVFKCDITWTCHCLPPVKFHMWNFTCEFSHVIYDFSQVIVHSRDISFENSYVWSDMYNGTKDKSPVKIGSVKPLLKKPGLDSEVPGNYRPISNLNNISKILERLFLRNIIDHVSSSPSFNSSQSAYRKDHSTETALLRLLNDIYCAADKKSRSLLMILLDPSAAFDTLDISTLIRRLEHTFGIVRPALSWIKSYLMNRSQFVRVGANRSAEVFCEYGVSQGLVLGPLLFTLYIAPVANVITSHGVSHLQYADDTQLYIALDKDESIEILQKCADAVYSWFVQNGFTLNPEKLEAILLGTGARLRGEEVNK